MDKNKNNNSEKTSKTSFSEKITLPWLIVTIASMISFLAFIIAMFFEFYASVFFGVFILIIACAVFLDGVHKRRQNYISGNLNFIMGVLCVICAVIVMNM
ncbi:MAG: hypothetical protein PUB20_07530 [Clostridia bacterium]|nr:hypothetical protein [Clostridia bacterium]